MPKASDLRKSLSSIDFPSLLIRTIKADRDYKASYIFCFQHENRDNVYLSFFKIKQKGVYAITEMHTVGSRLYEVGLDGDQVNFALLTEQNDNDSIPMIESLILENDLFKMYKIESWELSDELRVALGDLDREVEDIILDYAKYMLREEEVTTESTRRKLEAKLEDFYGNTKCSEREIDEAVSDFLYSCGFQYSSSQVNFVSRYGIEITKVIDCKKDGEKVLFLISYTIIGEGNFYDFIVNTVNSDMEIAGDNYYTSNLDKKLYRVLKNLAGNL